TPSARGFRLRAALARLTLEVHRALVAAALGDALEHRRLGRARAHQELGVALRARLRDRLLPDPEVALDVGVRVVLAPVERALAHLAADLDHLAAALRAGYSEWHAARRLALREGRAAEEPAVPAPALHHRRAAQLARDVGELGPSVFALAAFA